MKYQQLPPTSRVAPQQLDVTDTDFSAQTYIPRLEGLGPRRVQASRGVRAARALFRECDLAAHPCRQAVNDSELENSHGLVLQVDDKANVKYLAGHDPETRKSLLTVFRVW